MDTWDIRRLDLEPHRPQVLRSDKEMRVIAIDLPAGEVLQEHQVHERALLVVADGEIEVIQGGETTDRRARLRRGLRAGRAARGEGDDRCAPGAGPGPMARRGAPQRNHRLAPLSAGRRRARAAAAIIAADGPVPQAQGRLVVALGVAVLLAGALVYTSFSAATEAQHALAGAAPRAVRPARTS